MKPDDLISNAVSEEWLNSLITKAVEAKASDIHIEPDRDNLRIRYRVDGLLYVIETLSIERHEPIISRIKVVAHLDITEHRQPQDGHFEFSYGGLGGLRYFNVRVSTYPTIYGEVVVMRILNREESLIDMDGLGFDTEQLEKIENLISQPYGMVLITGPSGSGKTTLLYSILKSLNKPTGNIVTIEDPVELQMEGVRQTQVSDETGLTFAKALRAVLRQDPDIVMVGEIRDSDSAQIAIQAALTGRLFFSTFHTLSVFAVVARLIEMGIPRSVLANTIIGIVSARLVRKICPTCKSDYQLSGKEKKLFGLGEEDQGQFYAGKGCSECRQSGSIGRTGIYEVVTFDEDIRNAIMENQSSYRISEIIRGKKIKSLESSAMEKAHQGLISPQEVIRVIGKRL